MNLTAINTTIETAFTAALFNAQKQSAQPVGNNPNQTVAVVTYDAPTGSGFRVVGTINIDGCKIIRVRNYGPDTASEREWPDNIWTYVTNKTKKARADKAAYIYRCGRNASLKIFKALPIGVQAQFSPVFEASDKAAKSANYSLASDIVATCVVPAELQPAQQALTALLEQLIAPSEALKTASTIDEIEAIIVSLNP
jgi:hypothetical protein